ncbi:MerC domain-containing protein [Bdellovibrio bacteriovorus]|uniref:MerC domain-containing protein n=1 Tax=Bdellovibrio bacteriovorus TaxID=959 RepID=UPI0035A5B950
MDEQTLTQPSSAHQHSCCEVDHTQHEEFAEKTENWDRVGIFLSSLCAIHCLATPLLVLLLPVMGEFFHSEWVHLTMAVVILPVGLFAFWSGYKHHKQTRVFALGVLGLLMVAGASVLPHEWVEVMEHDVVTIAGSILLITAHILNRRACLCHKHEPARPK